MATQDTDLQSYIDQKVASGEFESAEELASEAIRVYRTMESDYDSLRVDVQNRIREADAGNVAPLDTEAIIAELETELNEDGTPK